MPTTVRSHAKINLGLGIGAPRPDGFHGLATVYQTLEVHDLLTVEAVPAAETQIQLTSNDKRVPCDNRNTAWKMVELVLEALELTAQVSIHIEKRLPVQGGLGAGSANAVAALVGLEKELSSQESGIRDRESGFTDQKRFDNEGCPIRRVPFARWVGDHEPLPARDLSEPAWAARRLEIAERVGSDVPLFLIGGTSLGVDRGQVVVPLPDLEPVWCVVATPELGVSTAQAFRDWDALCAEEGLTGEASADKLNELSRAYASAFAGIFPGRLAKDGSSGVLSAGEDLAETARSALVRTGITSWITNDFERVVFRQHPSLAEIKRTLAADATPERALHASLSGSGSALFGLYQTRGAAEAACERLERQGVSSILTRTVDRRQYWGQMLA
jgi:4-diphosphocytidyl-2-C-methyl-D-erythritol kinase